MNAVRQAPLIAEEEKCFLRTLLYFDIFNYPLTLDEVTRFSPSVMSFTPASLLESLISRGILFRFHNFYSLRNDPEIALRRLKGNELAEKKMKTAKRFSRIVSFFPFVRAVMLSGSISKGYMDEKSDIDYFIVTEVNRLWIVRTALAIFRRIFLFNSHKNFCTNYFVDDKNLEIAEKNLFTAIELRTIRPMFGKSVIKRFQTANSWAFSFLPNFSFEETPASDKGFIFKEIIEAVFSFRGLDNFNEWLMKKTIAYWNKKYRPNIHPADFEIAFRSTAGISKSHPQFFQKRVLLRYDQKIKEFEVKNAMDLTI